MSADPERRPGGSQPSWGNMSEHHWSRARRAANQEALEYYRARSRAPGVAEGGAERNFYCMECDGVIPHSPPVERCPHCDAALDDAVRRYFNWVEIDRPVESDLRALLPLIVGAVVVIGGALAALVAWLA